MLKFAVGQPVPRTEDPKLVKGRGRYLDDIVLPRQVHAYVLRSPHAHARILSIDTTAAKTADGVLLVLTGKDAEADNIGPYVSDAVHRMPAGTLRHHTTRPALVEDRVRVVGDPVAVVVAETLNQARDAAELIEIDYDPLPAHVDTAAALDPTTPPVWEDCPDNLSFVYAVGKKDAVDAAFAEAHHVTRQRFVINRITANTMEPRGCIADYDEGEGRFTLYAGIQSPHATRQHLANDVLHVPESKVRVVSGNLGGSFGMRGGPYAEYTLALWASRRLNRPVKWLADRSESFLSDHQARDNVTDAELALDADGKFLAVRVRTIANLGAYLGHHGLTAPTANLGSYAGVYTTPAIHVVVQAVYTNTHPTAPYRGAGRPEASCVLERLIEKAAREMDIDSIDLRRRNTIPAEAMPYKTGLTFVYDCGEFEKNMDMALEMADYAGFEARRAQSASRGKLRGFGLVNVIEQAAGRAHESAEIRFEPSGTVTLITGTSNHGQGHETTFKQILAERLGLDPDRIHFSEGDTDRAAHGTGTFGSRSAALGGSAILQAADKIVAKGKRIAAHMMEAAEADIVFADGAFTVAGTDKSVGIQAVAAMAFNGNALPRDIEIGFNEIAMYQATVANFPNGCHICEVEVDPDTGSVSFEKYVVVDDVGTVINPLLLKGQIVGGIVQGIGQAVMENMVYDADGGQLVSASFMDYAMPRADDLCSIEVKSNPVPTKTNPLGVKGAGEAGCVGGLPCALIAINNALAPLGVDYIEMPATPERIWRAIQEARRV